MYKAARIVLDRLEARTAGPRPQDGDEEIDFEPKHLDANFDFLGDQAVRIWLANHKLVSALASEFGFAFTFVLQPSLWTDGKPLHVSEKRILREEFESRAMTHIMATRAKMSSIIEKLRLDGSLPESVHSLANVFDATQEPLYIDYVHTAGPGNLIVAESLFGIVIDRICDIPPPEIARRIGDQIELGCDSSLLKP
jgi:hypothetical protein